jgi:hypothetical protein
MVTEKASDAIALLKADHRKVEELFEQFENARGDERKRRLVAEICTELKVHTMIEEEIFYPALRGRIADDMLDEAYVEHDGAKVLVNDLGNAQPGDDYYDAKVTVLAEEIRHHVHEEEMRGEGMFAQARKTDVDLDALGGEMILRKQELMNKARTDGLPAAKPSAVGVMAPA